MADVLVLGGGFGGLAAAARLRTLLPSDLQITLVDQRPEFYMGFAKLWALSGQRPLADGTRQLSQLADRGIGFLQADIVAINPRACSVTTSKGELDAEGLIVALGATPAEEHTAMLAGDGCYDLYDGRQLGAMRRELAAITTGRVVISILGGPHKCPPAPFEAALIVDQLLRDRGVRDAVEVAISTPLPMTLPVAGVDASRFVADHLAERNITLLDSHAVAGVNDRAREISFANGATTGYDLLFGVAADAPLPVVQASGLVGESGWIEPDRHTLATAFDRVYAVGDCTLIPTANGQLPRAGVFAAGGGRIAAANLAADLGHGSPARFDGHGHCFLELPGEQVAHVEGDFYADPPQVALTAANHEQFTAKLAFETDHLDEWLGPRPVST